MPSKLLQQALQLSEPQGIRVRVSRLLIATTLKHGSLDIKAIRQRLHGILEQIRQNHPPCYYYDLGFYETLETTLESLDELNWVRRENELFTLTIVGQAHLEINRSFLKKHTLASLDELV